MAETPMLGRRGFLRGLIAAPAVIAIDKLMPVKLFVPVVGPPFITGTIMSRRASLYPGGVVLFGDWYFINSDDSGETWRTTFYTPPGAMNAQ
jgi:hypothetical protein